MIITNVPEYQANQQESAVMITGFTSDLRSVRRLLILND